MLWAADAAESGADAGYMYVAPWPQPIRILQFSFPLIFQPSSAGAMPFLEWRVWRLSKAKIHNMLVEIYVIPCCRVESYDDISNII